MIKTKGNKERTVPFNAGLLRHIEPWLKCRDRLESTSRDDARRAERAGRDRTVCIAHTFFLTRYGDPVQPDHFSKTIAEYFTYSGLQKLAIHRLRHFTLSMLAHIDQPAAQSIAGHEDISTTEIYTHTEMDHMRAAIEKADPLAAVFVNKRTQARQRKDTIL